MPNVSRRRHRQTSNTRNNLLYYPFASNKTNKTSVKASVTLGGGGWWVGICGMVVGGGAYILDGGGWWLVVMGLFWVVVGDDEYDFG